MKKYFMVTSGMFRAIFGIDECQLSQAIIEISGIICVYRLPEEFMFDINSESLVDVKYIPCLEPDSIKGGSCAHYGLGDQMLMHVVPENIELRKGAGYNSDDRLYNFDSESSSDASYDGIEPTNYADHAQAQEILYNYHRQNNRSQIKINCNKHRKEEQGKLTMVKKKCRPNTVVDEWLPELEMQEKGIIYKKAHMDRKRLNEAVQKKMIEVISRMSNGEAMEVEYDADGEELHSEDIEINGPSKQQLLTLIKEDIELQQTSKLLHPGSFYIPVYFFVDLIKCMHILYCFRCFILFYSKYNRILHQSPKCNNSS